LSKFSEEENQELTEALYSDIDSYGYDYVPTLGYWKYEDMSEYEREKSCFVVGSGKVRDPNFLRNMKYLRKGFDQEAVLLSLITPLGYTIGYFWNKYNRYQRAGVFTAFNIERILEGALKTVKQAGYSELDGAKFVFRPEKVVRAWGAKNIYNVSRRKPSLLYTSVLAFSSLDKDVEALLADYDAWVEELEGSGGV
jgi:hypothetical protein